MQILHPEHSSEHQPPFEIFNGEQTLHSEIPARFENILRALKRHNFKLDTITEAVPLDLLGEIHSLEYLQYLQSTSVLDAKYHYPSVFQYRTGAKSQNNLARQGYFSFDLYTPLSNNTYQSALDSASTAYQAAHLIQTGAQRHVYALCRPPGHHAEQDQMGGYCYLNNCAVAAQYLSHSGRVATLDVDFHHGNGTQHIFYDRPDVFSCSIHADPNWKFPFFSGFENENGRDSGMDFNLNRTLQEGTTNQRYQRTLVEVVQSIADFHPKYLVVSFGADTHIADPIGGFQLTTEYFQEMGHTIADLNLPTVIVQEGGYNTELLGENVVSFLNGFEN